MRRRNGWSRELAPDFALHIGVSFRPLLQSRRHKSPHYNLPRPAGAPTRGPFLSRRRLLRLSFRQNLSLRLFPPSMALFKEFSVVLAVQSSWDEASSDLPCTAKLSVAEWM